MPHVNRDVIGANDDKKSAVLHLSSTHKLPAFRFEAKVATQG